MAMFISFVMLFTLAVFAEASPIGSIALDHYAVPNYAYNYAVHDPHTGDQKQKSEVRHGDLTKEQNSRITHHHTGVSSQSEYVIRSPGHHGGAALIAGPGLGHGLAGGLGLGHGLAGGLGLGYGAGLGAGLGLGLGGLY